MNMGRKVFPHLMVLLVLTALLMTPTAVLAAPGGLPAGLAEAIRAALAAGAQPARRAASQ